MRSAEPARKRFVGVEDTSLAKVCVAGGKIIFVLYSTDFMFPVEFFLYGQCPLAVRLERLRVVMLTEHFMDRSILK